MPLFWLSAAFLAGLVLAGWLELPWFAWLAAALACAACAVFLRWRRLSLGWLTESSPALKVAPLWLLCALLIGGARWAHAHQPFNPGDIAWYNGSGNCQVEGWLAARPQMSARSVLARLRAERVRCAGQEAAVGGLVQVQLPADSAWRYGQRLRIVGKLTEPPEGSSFSYRAYLANQGVYAWMSFPQVITLPGPGGNPLLRRVELWRTSGLRVLQELYPAPHAALLQGILLGVDDFIAPDVLQDFQASGLAHIIAISGFNLSLLSSLTLSLLRRRLPGEWAYLSAVGVVGLYTLLAGAEPSVVRAAIFFVLGIIALRIGRPRGGPNALLLAAALMAFVEPGMVCNVSFQLSFAAMFGLLSFSSHFDTWFASQVAEPHPRLFPPVVRRFIFEYILCTLAAQVFVLPIIAWHFRRISLVSLIANPLILPFQAPLMVLGLVSLVLGWIHPVLGKLAAFPANYLIWLTLQGAHRFASLPAAELPVNQAGFIAISILIFLLSGAVLLPVRYRPLLRNALLLYPLLGLVLLSGSLLAGRAQPGITLSARILNGETAILLRAPDGRYLFLGGAVETPRLDDAIAARLPLLPRWQAVLLPVGADQAGLARLSSAYHPRQALLCPDSRQLGGNLEQALRASATVALPAGQTAQWGALRLHNVATAPAQCAILLEYGRLRLLIPFSAELRSQDWNDPGLLLLVSAETSWNHPGVQRIPTQGWLRLSSDGQTAWIQAP